MSNKEAIYILQYIANNYCLHIRKDGKTIQHLQTLEAIYMAIKALEQEAEND